MKTDKYDRMAWKVSVSQRGLIGALLNSLRRELNYRLYGYGWRKLNSAEVAS